MPSARSPGNVKRLNSSQLILEMTFNYIVSMVGLSNKKYNWSPLPQLIKKEINKTENLQVSSPSS